MRNLVPGGARGVALKSKGPFNWASADKRGLMREGIEVGFDNGQRYERLGEYPIVVF